jgi:hypothetical protein
MKSVKPDGFNYLAPLAIYQSEKPYLSRLPSLPGFARTNILGQRQPTQVFDVSGNEHLFTLDGSGFEFVKFPNPLEDWTDSVVCETYIPSLACWLKTYLNCSEVVIYAYNVSRPECLHHGRRLIVAIVSKQESRTEARKTLENSFLSGPLRYVSPNSPLF